MAFNNHTSGQLCITPCYADVATQTMHCIKLVAELTSQMDILHYVILLIRDSDDFMYGTVGTHDVLFLPAPQKLVPRSFWPSASK
jgi:hypothetical protein